MSRELREAENGLLSSDESTGSIDVHVSVESSQWDRERIIGRRERHGAGYESLVRIRLESFGTETYHCKRLR